MEVAAVAVAVGPLSPRLDTIVYGRGWITASASNGWQLTPTNPRSRLHAPVLGVDVVGALVERRGDEGVRLLVAGEWDGDTLTVKSARRATIQEPRTGPFLRGGNTGEFWDREQCEEMVAEAPDEVLSTLLVTARENPRYHRGAEARVRAITPAVAQWEENYRGFLRVIPTVDEDVGRLLD